MAQPISDRDLLDALGLQALLDAGYTKWQFDKWRASDRGIPWRERGKVAKIAKKCRQQLPPRFDEERTAA